MEIVSGVGTENLLKSLFKLALLPTAIITSSKIHSLARSAGATIGVPV